ncbi:MAG: hypothetical protein HYY50_04525, partial [Candidatus Kerfeldbacteria bacterium]|nr:hypothetical protein [Candidatus Kerfeldbacteria bacterium]
MNASTPVFITVMASTVGLAFFVYFKNPSRLANRTFSLLSLAVAGWTAGTWAGSYFAETQAGLRLGRVAFAMAILMAYALLVFLHVFPASFRLPRSFPVTVFGTLAAALTLVSVTTPWIMTALTIDEGNLKVQYGPLYPLFAVYILACVGYSFSTICRKIHVARGVERLQLKYLFAGLL